MKSKEHVLVTGGAGYIGSHTCYELREIGMVPVTLDNLSRGHKELVKFGPFVQGDVGDSALVFKVIQEFNIKSVIHFAAFAYVGESTQKPELYYENNFKKSACLINSAVSAGVKNFIFSSSCAVYGVPSSVPIHPDMPRNPVNPYGWSKLFIELLLQHLAEQGQLNSIVLRYFNAAGARVEEGLGELHDPETHLIPLAIQATLTDGDALKIFGSDYSTPDGTCIRDYIHVQDLAMAHLAALNHLKTKTDQNYCEAFNLGSGKGTSVLEIISEIEEQTGLKVKSVSHDRREGDPPVLFADFKRTTEVLGWEPQSSTIRQVISDALRWERRSRDESRSTHLSSPSCQLGS